MPDLTPPLFAFVGWGAMFPPLALLAVFDALVVWRLARADRQWRAEIIALVAVQGLACWLVATFFTSNHIGAGDSYHYGLQVADFITQLRHGVFPIFVGQSEFGFNGNIHTMRTAPYYVHLGALLNFLTAGKQSFFGIQNLCVIVSVLGGGTSAYIAVRTLAPAWRVVAPFLAALYLLCPALMVILIGMDMYPTIMVLPWLPIFWLGVAGGLEARDDTRWLILSTASLALIWYAHPAVAAWLSPFWCAALAVRFVFVARGPGRFAHPILAGAALGWLVIYLFVSVSTLHLQYSNNLYGRAAEAIMANLQLGWAASWKPLVAPIGNLGNIQLGYALTGVGVGCLFGLRRSGLAGMFFAGVSALLLLLLLPITSVIQPLWHAMPDKLLDATNVWPMQRFYPILAGALPIWAALTLRGITPRQSLKGMLIVALAVGVAWGIGQEKLPRSHAVVIMRTPASTSTLLAPGNIKLGRVSYLFFGFYPSYYSHGITEPTFETRLLDRDMKPVLDNASALYALKSAAPPTATLTPKIGIYPLNQDIKRREATFKTDGHSQYLLAFSFPAKADGVFELFAPDLYRQYTLPEFGEAHAFGAGSQSTPYLPLCLAPGTPETVLLRTELTGLTARVFAFQPEELPIRTLSLMPLEIQTTAAQAGYVETPRVLIPGYRATVNGIDTPVVRSLEGLVAVPVSAGPARVVVSYEGPRALRLAFWFSLVGFGLLPWFGLWAWRRAARFEMVSQSS